MVVSTRPLHLVIADDAVLVRAGLVRLLMATGFVVDAEVGSARELLEAVRAHDPDVAVVDVRMPPTHTDDGMARGPGGAAISRNPHRGSSCCRT